MILTWGAEDGLPRAGNTGAAAPLGALAGAGVAREGAAAWTPIQLPKSIAGKGALTQAMANALNSSMASANRRDGLPRVGRKHWGR